MQVNLLTKVRFTLRTLKYYFEVFLHLKAKKLWFLNICSKIFRFRNCYERVLFLCTIFVRKCRLKKNESQFFDNCGGPRGYLGLQTIKYSMKPSPFTPYSFSMKVGSPSHSRQLVAKSKSVVNELGSPLWSRKTVSVSDDRHGKDAELSYRGQDKWRGHILGNVLENTRIAWFLNCEPHFRPK